MNNEDAKELVEIVRLQVSASKDIESDFKVGKVDEGVIVKISMYADTQISPCCSFWGGIIAQEVIKITGKYTPLRQWLHHDFLDIIPDDVDRSPNNSRYDDYVVLFGKQFVEEGARKSIFLVGAGALGCEFIKMSAMMGLNTQSTFTCTDDDKISPSNLSRQFLYKKNNIGENKS